VTACLLSRPTVIELVRIELERIELEEEN